MKILYSRTQFWFNLKAGGSVGHTAGVLKGLSQLAQVEIISNEPLPGADQLPCKIVKPIPGLWPGELLYNFYFAPHLAAKIRAFQPDFVYHRYNGDSFSTASICSRLEVPLVLEFNSSDLWKIRYWKRDSFKARITSPLRRIILHFSEPFNLRSASLIVVVSTPLKESLLSQGFPADRILVNPNAVDAEKFKPAPPNVCSKIRQELNIPSERIVVGFSGTFGEWHGIPELTEAILRLNSDPLWRERMLFVLCGDGYLRPSIQDRVGHFDNVRFTGIVEYEHIQDYLSVCDILLSPHGATPDGRRFFGSPTKLFEYMAMAKGIVASDLDQIGQVLAHGETAVLVEPGDVGDLVRGIVFLAEHPDQAERMGRNARRVVCENHTWYQNARRVVEALP